MFITRSTRLIVLIVMITSLGLNGQTMRLTGKGICGDRFDTTPIGVEGTLSKGWFVLYCDDVEMDRVEMLNPSESKKVLFGKYKRPGVYTARFFANSEQMSNSTSGSLVSGKVNILQVPKILIKQDTLSVNSGSIFTFFPESNFGAIDFMWTAKLLSGHLMNLPEKGRGLIVLPLEMDGKNSALVEFTLTPIAPPEKGGCLGDPVRQFVKVRSN